MSAEPALTEPDKRAPAYERILLKLSGEALMGELAYGTDPDRVHSIAADVAAVQRRGVQVAIVVGGGATEGLAKGRPDLLACVGPAKGLMDDGEAGTLERLIHEGIALPA